VKLPNLIGRALCKVGFHSRKLIAYTGDTPFCIVPWYQCRRCGRVQIEWCMEYKDKDYPTPEQVTHWVKGHGPKKAKP
jgi:hypothetical protein